MKIEREKNIEIENNNIIRLQDNEKLIGLYGDYGIIARNYRYDLVDSYGYIVRGGYNNIQPYNNNFFVCSYTYDCVQHTEIIENGEVLCTLDTSDNECRCDYSIDKISDNLFEFYYYDIQEQKGIYNIIDKYGNMVVENIDYKNYGATSKYLIYKTGKETEKNHKNILYITDVSSKTTEEISFAFSFDIILVNQKSCIIKNESEYSVYVYDFVDKKLSSFDYSGIMTLTQADIRYINSVDELEGIKYFYAKVRNGPLQILDRDLNVVLSKVEAECIYEDYIYEDCYVCTDKHRKYLLVKNFNNEIIYRCDYSKSELYYDGIYSFEEKLWYDFKSKKVYTLNINDKVSIWGVISNLILTKDSLNKFGLYDITNGYYIVEEFDNIELFDKWIVIDKKYIVPRDEIRDIKVKYNLIITDDNNQVHTLTYNHNRDITVAEMTFREELEKQQKQYNQELDKLNNKYKQSRDNIVKRLVLSKTLEGNKTL